ncbi:MAG: DUF1460 domain-containing protein [Phocaeicola vulgatus]|nr:MAG: DUF1460 domain-containing protein [Phocaeicola vulgatus]
MYLNSVPTVDKLCSDILMDETAKFFLGVPYVGKTLEYEPERLIVNLREMDCMTFVENVLALAEASASGTPSWQAYLEKLQQIRYRDGKIEDYTSRLHYTSDWIYENEKKGLIADITKEIGGVPLAMDVSFVSTHPESYMQLQSHPEYIAVMAKKEKEINSRQYYYIPKEEIDKREAQIRTGDIVCFVTSIKGLDISHVGIVHKEGDKMTFIHASSGKKRVIINEESLQDYVLGIKKSKGIIVLRPQFVTER